MTLLIQLFFPQTSTQCFETLIFSLEKFNCLTSNGWSVNVSQFMVPPPDILHF